MSFTHVRTRNAPSPTGIPHTGNSRTVTPHIFDCMTVLGKQSTLDRINRIFK